MVRRFLGTFQVVAIFVAFLTANSVSTAEDRVWTGQSGATVTAELASVTNGQVLLKQGTKRLRFNLSEFVLEDREYIVEKFARRNSDRISELMKAAANVKVREPKGGQGNRQGRGQGRGAGNGEGAAFDGFDLPSPELKNPTAQREWTDLLGNKVKASFERLLAPAHMRLKGPDGKSRPFPMVNFVRADLDYVRAVLKSDAANGVFPVESPKMSDEQRDSGYRTFHDRAEVSLDAKLIRTADKDVVLQYADEEHTFELAALSEADREWITTELARRAESPKPGMDLDSATGSAAMAAKSDDSMDATPAAMATEAMVPDGNAVASIDSQAPSTKDFFPTEAGMTGASVATTVEENEHADHVHLYRYECSHCNRVWTSNNPKEQCQKCKNLFKYKCNVCNHTWTKNNKHSKQCAKCLERQKAAGETSTVSDGGSSSAGRTAGLVLIPLIIVSILGFGIWKMSAG